MSGNVPAHPVLAQQPGTYEAVQHLGLTKREMFAAMIFQQFLSGAVLPPEFDASEQLRFAASRATEAADALIAELNKETP